MRAKLVEAMEKYFGNDRRRVKHAYSVLNYAERIIEKEEGDLEIIVAAAILHDIGIHLAEMKYGSTSGKYQEIEGPPIAKEILQRIKFPQEKIAEVLEIIAYHHSPGKVKTNNYSIIYDADMLVNIKDEYNLKDKEVLAKLIDKVFFTKTAREIARTVYLS